MDMMIRIRLRRPCLAFLFLATMGGFLVLSLA